MQQSKINCLDPENIFIWATYIYELSPLFVLVMIQHISYLEPYNQ